MEEARKHNDEICNKEKEINGKNPIVIRNDVKSFLTLVFYQFKIYRMKGIEDYYYKIDSAGKYIGEKGKLGSKECTVKQEFPVLFKVGLVDILTKVFNQNSRKVLQKLMSISDNSKERNLILEELNKIILGSSWKMDAGQKFIQKLQDNLSNADKAVAVTEYWYNEPRYEALIAPYEENGLHYIVAEFRSQSTEGLLKQCVKELDGAITGKKDIDEEMKTLTDQLRKLFNEKY